MALKTGKVRKALEQWVEFINPYQRIRRSIESLTKELESLNLSDKGLAKKDLADYESPEDWAKDWERQDRLYSRTYFSLIKKNERTGDKQSFHRGNVMETWGAKSSS
jgi:hypothetical protein